MASAMPTAALGVAPNPNRKKRSGRTGPTRPARLHLFLASIPARVAATSPSSSSPPPHPRASPSPAPRARARASPSPAHPRAGPPCRHLPSRQPPPPPPLLPSGGVPSPTPLRRWTSPAGAAPPLLPWPPVHLSCRLLPEPTPPARGRAPAGGQLGKFFFSFFLSHVVVSICVC